VVEKIRGKKYIIHKNPLTPPSPLRGEGKGEGNNFRYI
jgi:hypothetical protein